MSKQAKLLERLKSQPKDFTFRELVTLMNYFDYKLSNQGKTSGSRVRFVKNGGSIVLHKPHPQKEFAQYQIKIIINTLRQEGLI